MSTRTEIRDRAAEAALVVAKSLGTQCVFTEANGTATTLYCTAEGFSQSGQMRKSPTDEYRGQINIFRQPGFPPSEISFGCTITFPVSGGKVYELDNIEYDNEDINMFASVTFTLGRFGYNVETGG